MAQLPAGARAQAGTGELNGRAERIGATRYGGTRPIPTWGFAGVAIASLGGPLALAALIAPSTVAGAGSSAGLEMVVAVVVFAVPLGLWLRYSRYINSAGGLYSFVEAAAGRRVALAQAAVWTVSYGLYLIYTTVQIVYDMLPAAVPSVRAYQSLLAVAIPVAIAAVMIAGRAAALIAIGLIAAAQVVLAGVLDGVTLAHVSTPVSSFGASAGAGSVAKASAQSSLLYICGSLPLFLGGELATPARTIRRGLIGAYALTGLVILLAVAPLAALPGVLQTSAPGVTVAREFSGNALAEAIGIGVAASTAGVILCEYLAVSRLLHAVTSVAIRPITIGIGALMALAAPFTLIDPEGFYGSLIKPSLAALWISELIVFAVYPLFARKHGQRALPAYALGTVASGLAVYGLWISV